MGKNDLLSEDDFFTLSNKDEDASEKSDKHNSASEDELFKELEFDQSEQSQQKTEPEIIIDDHKEQPVPVSGSEIQQKPSPISPPPIEEDKTKEATSTYRYDFDDYNQEGVNYKPVIIGIIIVACLAVAGYFSWDFIFGEDEPVVVEEVQQGPSPEEIAKADFYSSLTGKTRYHYSNFNKVITLVSDNNKLSSLMLYENDFVFEIFSKDRAALARYFREIQTSAGSNRVTLSATTDRPGSRGGVFGQFNLTLNPNGMDKAEVTDPFISNDQIRSWLNTLAAGNGLKTVDVRSASIASRDIYRGTQIEAGFNGSFDNVKGFLTQLANSNKNLIIHKLSLISTDLKTFSQKKYQLKLVLKAYI